MQSETVAVPSPDVVCTELEDDQAVLMHVGTQSCYRLNTTGLEIWRAIGRGLTLIQIGRELEQLFDVTEELALNSVVALAQELAREDLVSFSPSAEGGGA